ncbi:MAG: hypothetical protein ACP5NA_07870 [Candidatus Acidulodesulfobacterium sp.]
MLEVASRLSSLNPIELEDYKLKLINIMHIRLNLIKIIRVEPIFEEYYSLNYYIRKYYIAFFIITYYTYHSKQIYIENA